MALPIDLANRVSQQSSRTLNQRVIVAEYGDGVSQAAKIGINPNYDEWTIQFNDLDTTLRTTFITFWKSVGMFDTWTWTPLNEANPKTFRIIEPPVETNNGCLYNFTLKCREVF